MTVMFSQFQPSQQLDPESKAYAEAKINELLRQLRGECAASGIRFQIFLQSMDYPEVMSYYHSRELASPVFRSITDAVIYAMIDNAKEDEQIRQVVRRELLVTNNRRRDAFEARLTELASMQAQRYAQPSTGETSTSTPSNSGTAESQGTNQSSATQQTTTGINQPTTQQTTGVNQPPASQQPSSTTTRKSVEAFPSGVLPLYITGLTAHFRRSEYRQRFPNAAREPIWLDYPTEADRIRSANDDYIRGIFSPEKGMSPTGSSWTQQASSHWNRPYGQTTPNQSGVTEEPKATANANEGNTSGSFNQTVSGQSSRGEHDRDMTEVRSGTSLR